jgi:hypothetical protein
MLEAGANPGRYEIRSKIGAGGMGERVIDLDPNFPGGDEQLGLAYLGKRLYPETLSEFQKAIDLSGRGRRSVSYFRVLLWRLTGTSQGACCA